MSWQQRTGTKTPSRSRNPRKRGFSVTTYSSLPSGTPPPHNLNQRNNLLITPNNYPQYRTLEECWGLPTPSTDHLNNIPEAFGHYYDSRTSDSFRCVSHNINNIPNNAFWPKSKIITKMAQGADQADIKLWQETGIY